MAVDTKSRTGNKSASAAPAEATKSNNANDVNGDPWADYSSLAEATKTKSGFAVLRSLAGETVFITTMEQDEATKTYIATLVNVDTDKASKTFGTILGERGKFAVPPTYAKKLAAALKAKPTNAPGIRVNLGEQKRGIGLS